MTLKRYTFDPDTLIEVPCECSMEECPTGEYVLYEDYEAANARADAAEAKGYERGWNEALASLVKSLEQTYE